MQILMLDMAVFVNGPMFIYFNFLQCSTVVNLLKSDSHLTKKFLFICFNESPLKMMKIACYFILKALFVLKKFKFLFRHFDHVEETA